MIGSTKARRAKRSGIGGFSASDTVGGGKQAGGVGTLSRANPRYAEQKFNILAQQVPEQTEKLSYHGVR
jgi:hypothetical protein